MAGPWEAMCFLSNWPQKPLDPCSPDSLAGQKSPKYAYFSMIWRMKILVLSDSVPNLHIEVLGG